MGFWSKLLELRIPIKILAGGHIFTDKDLGIAVRSATIFKGSERGYLDVQIPFDERKSFKFERISWEPSGSRSAGKAAAGAIAGTLVAGPIGAIAGAAMGGKKKDTSSAFLYLIDQDGKECEVHIECTKQQYSQIANLPY